jgi:hypothetical protein
MAQRSRDFEELLRLSLCAAAESIAVGDDGLDRIRIRLAQAQSSASADDRAIAMRELCAQHRRLCCRVGSAPGHTSVTCQASASLDGRDLEASLLRGHLRERLERPGAAR